MSGQVDTKALRALVDERQGLLLTMLNDGPILSSNELGSMAARIEAINQELDAAAPTLLDAAEERDELRDLVEKYESARRNPGSDERHRGTSTALQLVHAQHMREKAESERDALRARVADLQAEVDACGEIIGQPPGAPRGHAEIIAATIARHQEHGEQLAARVGELEREVDVWYVEVQKLRAQKRNTYRALVDLANHNAPDSQLLDILTGKSALAPRPEVSGG